MGVTRRIVSTVRVASGELLKSLTVIVAQLAVVLIAAAGGAAAGGVFSRGGVGLSVGFLLGLMLSIISGRWLTGRLEMD